MGDRKKDTGYALTEVRTARSRAESAIAAINAGDGRTERRWTTASFNEEGDYVHPQSTAFRDPDADEMVAALQAFVDATAKWANKTRKPGVINQRHGA